MKGVYEMDYREQAKRLLKNYFKAIASKAGIRWDSDYDVEIADIVDLIMDGVKKELMQELQEVK